MLKTGLRLSTFAFASAFATWAAGAANTGRGEGLNLTSFGSVNYLGSPQVRRELKLDHNVSLKIRKALDTVALASRGGFMTVSQAEEQRKLREATDVKALHREAMGYLDLAQKRRLGQISLQTAGPYIFSDTKSPVSRYLGLTVRQRERLSAGLDSEGKRYVSAIKDLMKADQDWYGDLNRTRYQAKYAAHDRKFQRICVMRGRKSTILVDRMLTSSQKAQWKALLGKPFPFAQITYDTVSVPMD